jgi:hypothetical protein
MRELPHFAEGAHFCLCDLTSVATGMGCVPRRSCVGRLLAHSFRFYC